MVTGRSRCDGCGRMLSMIDLVPVLSFTALRGRCRTCGSRIDWLQPAAEILGACIGLGAWLAMASPAQAVVAALLGWQLLVLGLSDWRAFHLPPTGIALLAVSAAILPLLAIAHDLPAETLVLRQLAGGGLGYVLLAAPALAFRAIRGRDGMGSADPPLMGAAGLWAGPTGVCFILLLAAVLGIVRGHRGAIEIDSGPSRGTSFRIFFPMTDKHTERDSASVEAALDWAGTGTILVVDDDEAVLELARETLQRCGLDTITAVDGRSGIDAFAKNLGLVDAVLLDRTMPGLTGEEVVAELRKRLLP